MPCPDSPPVAVTPTDPGVILDRLPPALFNLARPTVAFQPALRCGDVLRTQTVFGPAGSDDATPQWEVSRILAWEKDEFLRAWANDEAIQHALGTSQEDVTSAPVARDADLDRWWAQFGIGRPSGFGDCCYHRLAQLLLFGSRGRWRLLEIAEMYTGTRPTLEEAPNQIRLRWPVTTPNITASALDDNAHLDDAFMDSEDIVGSAADDGFFDELSTSFLDTDQSPEELGIGLTLLQALNLVKADGVHLELVDLPPVGWSGCAGESSRHAATAAGRWS